VEQTVFAPEVQAQMIDVAGTPVAVRRKGSGDPVLFFHGAAGTGKWLRFHEALTDGAEVIAPEHIGFGATPFQEWLGSFDDLVLHYDDFRRELGLERFHLVGYSMGGWLAAAYATVFPDQLQSLTLVVPGGIKPEGEPPFLIDLFGSEPEDIFGAIFNDPANIGEIAVDLTDLDNIATFYDEFTTVARLLWNPRWDRRMTRRLRRVTCPSLIVGAEHDRVIPDAVVDLYAEHIADARVERVPGTGHGIAIEQPEATARIIRDFQRSAS
jgi:pimeloyl-ACP methyl ester carboxylesterase